MCIQRSEQDSQHQATHISMGLFAMFAAALPRRDYHLLWLESFGWGICGADWFKKALPAPEILNSRPAEFVPNHNPSGVLVGRCKVIAKVIQWSSAFLSFAWL